MSRSLAVVLVLLAAPALADEAEQRRLGEAVARSWCADCHAMPGATGAVSDVAPGFAGIAMTDIDGARFRGALADPHPAMPDPGLSREQAEAVWRWIESLRP